MSPCSAKEGSKSWPPPKAGASWIFNGPAKATLMAKLQELKRPPGSAEPRPLMSKLCGRRRCATPAGARCSKMYTPHMAFHQPPPQQQRTPPDRGCQTLCHRWCRRAGRWPSLAQGPPQKGGHARYRAQGRPDHEDQQDQVAWQFRLRRRRGVQKKMLLRSVGFDVVAVLLALRPGCPNR